jgi:hypothetical protein
VFHAFAARVHQKFPRDRNHERPLLRGNAPKTEQAAGLRKLGSPAFRRKIEGVGRKADSVFSGGGSQLIAELERMHFPDFPELAEAKFGVARIVGRNIVRKGRSIPGSLERAGPIAAARQAHVERIERLVAGIL